MILLGVEFVVLGLSMTCLLPSWFMGGAGLRANVRTDAVLHPEGSTEPTGTDFPLGWGAFWIGLNVPASRIPLPWTF